MPMGEHFWWWGWWFFPFMMPVGMIVIVLLAIYLLFIRPGFRTPWGQEPGRFYPPGSGPETPLDILKKRYAKGEISREEFEQMKKDLG